MMFSNLVESGSHAADLKRKGSFFIGTLAFYGLLLLATGVGSIYAYNAHVGGEEYEVQILKFAPNTPEQARPQRTSEPRRAASAASGGRPQVATVTEVAVNRPLPNGQIAREDTPVLKAGTAYVIGKVNNVPTDGGGIPGVGDRPGGHAGTTGPDGVKVTEDGEDPPAREAKPQPTPAPAPRKPEGPVRVSPGVMASKAVSKPPPPYPTIAKAARVQGPVTVQILVDEQGRVVSAKATAGNPLLQAAAVQAAYQARFTPTMLGTQAVKVTGVITYNFQLH
jgi:protein TonB